MAKKVFWRRVAVFTIILLGLALILLLKPAKAAAQADQVTTAIPGKWEKFSLGKSFALYRDGDKTVESPRVLLQIDLLDMTAELKKVKAEAERRIKKEYPGYSLGKPVVLVDKHWVIGGIPMAVAFEYRLTKKSSKQSKR